MLLGSAVSAYKSLSSEQSCYAFGDLFCPSTRSSASFDLVTALLFKHPLSGSHCVDWAISVYRFKRREKRKQAEKVRRASKESQANTEQIDWIIFVDFV